MKINSVQNVALTQKLNSSNIVDTKSNFNRIDVAFMGNLQADEIAGKFSKDAPNLIFTPGEKAREISFCGQKNIDGSNGKKNILVTGGSGYIGSHCAAYLLENGYNVVVVDDLSVGNHGAVDVLRQIAKKNGSQFAYRKVNIANEKRVGNILHDNNIEAVIHFAAYSQVNESVANPLKYYDNNIGGTVHLLRAMKAQGVNKIVFSSTAATYGEPKGITEANPITEETPQNPINPYGHSKVTIEGIMDACDYNKKTGTGDKDFNLKSTRFRYFNVAGAHPESKLGEVHVPETHLIPIALQKASGEREKFQIYGHDYNTEDKTCIRDYIHVQDLARAHYMGIQRLLDGGETAYYNLGTGKGSSNLEVYKTVCEVTGMEEEKDPAKLYTGRRPGDPDVLIASGKKAAKPAEEGGLGFKAEYSLKDMVKHAWSWMQTPAYKKWKAEREQENAKKESS